MSDQFSIREQLRRNAVALISLVVAISSLGYNTWRNERTERNRNVRTAGFQLMSELVKLQQVVYLAHYDMDVARGNPRLGWTHVLAIRDLSFPMPDHVKRACEQLYLVWQSDWENLEEDTRSLQTIDDAIDEAKSEILSSIHALR